MSKFFETILIAFATFIAAVLMPKHFITFIRELGKFILKSVVKNWLLTTIILLLIFTVNFLTKYKFLGEFYSSKFITITSIFIIVIVFIKALIKELTQKIEGVNVTFYGCFSVKETEYLTFDIDSENINNKIEQICERTTKNLFIFRNNLIKSKLIMVPKFIPILLGYNGINRFIKKKVNSHKHLASIHFFRNINTSSLSVIINVDKENFNNTTPIINAENLINTLIFESNLNNQKIIETSVKIYLLLFAQSYTDMMLDNKDYKSIHFILSDTEKLINEIRNDTAYFPAFSNKAVTNFLEFWEGYVERYKSIVFLEQNQLKASIKHIIKSIKLNPYFPYDSYISLKQDFTKKYGIALVPLMSETNEILKSDSNNSEELMKIKAVLEEQVQHLEMTFNYEIIKGILQRENTEEMVEFLLKEMEQLDSTNPFILLSKSEVIRYMKKGSEKFNELYVDRFDDCINLLKETLRIDNEFPLINTKLGMMMLMKGIHYNNKKQIDEGFKEYLNGAHIMLELGFRQNQEAD